MKRVLFYLVAIMFFLLPRAALPQSQEQIKEEVVVVGSRIPTEFATLSRTVTVIDRETIATSPARSISELLQTIMSVDIRPRGPMGVQADLSIRGSSFSQVLVMVDGIKVHDPQTAHHNLNLPVALQDIERIEVLRGQGSAPYGENALGGVINIITKKSGTRGLKGHLAYGRHNSLAGGLTADMGSRNLHQAFSLDYGASDGFAYNRDYRTMNLSSRTNWTLRKANIYLLAGSQDKDFGADGFYGPYPSKEWTQTRFAALKVKIKQTRIHMYARHHRDKFMLDISQPEFYLNIHRTLSTGFEASRNISLSPTLSMVFGGEARRDSISGERLGDHVTHKAGLFGEFQALIGSQVHIQSGLRWDSFSVFGSEVSPSFSLSWLFSQKLKFRISAGHAFRIPSFTELNYDSPANKGNPRLRAEHSLSLEAGIDWSPDLIMVSATIFQRRDRDVIDWIRRAGSDLWTAENIQRVTFSGLEFSLSHRNGLRFGYTYIHSDPAEPRDFLSKYRLNHPIHQVTSGMRVNLSEEIRADFTAVVKKRAHSGVHTVLDLRLRKTFKGWSIFLSATNILDEQYEEIPGVRMPGRWIGLGFDFRP